MPLTAKARTKALKAKKVVQKDVHSHTHTHTHGRSACHLSSGSPRNCSSKGTQVSSLESSQEKQVWPLRHQAPLTTKSAMKKIEDNSTHVFITLVKANKHQIKQGMKKVYDIDMAKVNTLIRPDGRKKANVSLASMMFWRMPTSLGLPELSPAG